MKTLNKAERMLEQVEESGLGKRLLDRFGAGEVKDIDLGNGDVIKMNVPRSYSEYNNILSQAQARFRDSGQEDVNYIYVYILEAVISNLNPLEIEAIVMNCPGLTDILIKTLDEVSGNVYTRLEKEAFELARKKSEKTQPGT